MKVKLQVVAVSSGQFLVLHRQICILYVWFLNVILQRDFGAENHVKLQMFLETRLYPNSE